jgi:hypothetical protein
MEEIQKIKLTKVIIMIICSLFIYFNYLEVVAHDGLFNFSLYYNNFLFKVKIFGVVLAFIILVPDKVVLWCLNELD